MKQDPIHVASRTLFLVLAASMLATQPTFAETYLVTPGRLHPADSSTSTLLGASDVGTRYCQKSHCVVVATTAFQKAALSAKVTSGAVYKNEITDANIVYFQNSNFDASVPTFVRSFPGDTNFTSALETVAIVHFKSFPQDAWLTAVRGAGLTLLHSLPRFGYLVYGPRTTIQNLPGALSYIDAVAEVPTGAKRSAIDTLRDGDPGGTVETSVVMAEVTTSPARQALATILGNTPIPYYQSSAVSAYSVPLTVTQAQTLSEYGEVIRVTRIGVPGEPSDERINRIVGGSPGTVSDTWQSTILPLNTPNPMGEYFWDYSQPDVPSDQTIAFLDTGISRLSGACPPFLVTPSSACNLTFSADATGDHTVPNLRALDRFGHGTLVSSIAAGFNLGRDLDGYSMSQGLAQDAKVAMTRIFRCPAADATYRSMTYESGMASGNILTLARYGLVEMGTTAALPDQGGVSPNAKIFNHSWNVPPGTIPPGEDEETWDEYDTVSDVLDRSARDGSEASFTFGVSATDTRTATPPGMLHVVSAGNCGSGCELEFSRRVAAPGMAKNTLTVGATLNSNQEAYENVCQSNEDAADPREVPLFSRASHTAVVKPDLVAPGVRAYGFRSENLHFDCSGVLCDVGIGPGSDFSWAFGTSFSAPSVSAAAAFVRKMHIERAAINFACFNLEDTYADHGNPSPALIRATLIAASKYLPGVTAREQGWGALSLDTLYLSDYHYSYYFLDQTKVLQEGDSWSHVVNPNFASPVGENVSIVLTWTEPPSSVNRRSIQNHLQLVVEDAFGNKWFGNNLDQNGLSKRYTPTTTPGPEADLVNNVAKVSIPKAFVTGVLSTSLKITIRATDLTADALCLECNPDPANKRQDFALAVIGAVDSDLLLDGCEHLQSAAGSASR